jgi:DNA polymerase III subunit chi
MTKIDFYNLTTGSRRNVGLLCCQLTEKAFLNNNFIYIHSSSLEQANNLDELLWKYKKDSFLPHINLSQNKLDDYDYPILINTSDSIANHYNLKNHPEFLINLSHSIPEFFSQFHRLAEVVDKDEESKQAARERFRFYKDRGYHISTHHV